MAGSKRKFAWIIGLLAGAAIAAVVVWMVLEHRESKDRFQEVQRGVLYRFRQPEEAQWRYLARRNIKTVVNLRSPSEDPAAFEREKAECAAAGAEMLNLPVTEKLPTDEQVRQFLSQVRHAKGAVLVHCAQGRSRTGIMVAAYRVVVQGWLAAKAMDEMVETGYHAHSPEESHERLDLLGRLARDRRDWLAKTAPEEAAH